MEGKEKLNKELFGLLGKNISYSFSKGYFSDKFNNLQLINHEYVNFDIEKIEDVLNVVHEFKTSLKGFNITIPYKQSIFNYLDEVDATANEIGAVNTVKLTNNGKLIGYNSDVVGFEKSIVPLLKKHHTKALILGTGGASKAVAFGEALKLGMGIALISSIIGVTYQVLLVTVIDPDTIPKMIEVAKNQLFDTNPEMSQEQLDQILEMQSKFISPKMMVAFGLIGGLLISFIISMISGLILKRNRPE